MDINLFIDEVARKFGYGEELIEALKRVVPIMMEDKDEEEKELIRNTLRRVQIILFDEQPTQEQIDELKKSQRAGRNSQVTFNEASNNEYDKVVAPAAYESEPIFDEQMRVVDRLGYIYLTNNNKYHPLYKTYQTPINLSHLIHELGHAYASEKDEYVQSEDGSFTTRTGTYIKKSIIDREKKSVEEVSSSGLYDEEALNTIEEERILYKLLGVDNFWDIEGYCPSKYQGIMTQIMRTYIEQIGEDCFRKYRLKGNRNNIDDIQEVFAETEFFKDKHRQSHYERKKESFYSFEDTVMPEESKQNLRDFFTYYNDLFFTPGNYQENFFQHLDRVLEEAYTFQSIRLNYNLSNQDVVEGKYLKIVDAYKKVVSAIKAEAYEPLNQFADIRKDRGGSITISNISEQLLNRTQDR